MHKSRFYTSGKTVRFKAETPRDPIPYKRAVKHRENIVYRYDD